MHWTYAVILVHIPLRLPNRGGHFESPPRRPRLFGVLACQLQQQVKKGEEALEAWFVG